MPGGGEGGLDGIAGADALPMLCWEVEEGHEFLTIFLQAHSGLAVLYLIGLTNRTKAFPASSLVSACQMLCIAALAFG